MPRFIFSFILLAATAMNALAYEVKAVVTDSIGDPLPYVTYRIYAGEADTIVVSGTGDELGAFAQPLDSAGNYRVELSYTGMATLGRDFSVTPAAPVADLGILALMDGAEQLEGVTVTAQRPLVVRQIDRIAYDVQADPETPTVTLNEILRKVPLVTVDPDGTIKVNGSTNFKIYKNGRPNNSLSRNAKDLFAALPASMIKRIEVITEPGAAYDAEGTSAILNIVTEENSSIKGVLGSVSTYWRTRDRAPGFNAWMTTEIDKVTLNIYGGYQHLGGESYRSTSRSMVEYPDGTSRLSENSHDMRGNLGYYGIDGSYQPDTLNLFTIELSGYSYGTHNNMWSYNPLFNQAAEVIKSYRSTMNQPTSGYTDLDANVNWQHNTHRKGETYTLSYMLSHTNQRSSSETQYFDMIGMSMPYTTMLRDYNLDFYEHTVQGDWARQLGKHNLDFGFKGIFRRNHSTNENNYVGVLEESREFSHKTDIAAVYGQYSVSVGKVNMRAGLRYEFSHLKASYPDGSAEDYSSNLSDLVPTVAVSWQVNDANSLSFNYSTSINRPGISYLNPAVSVTPVSLSFGNPDLGSARRQSMKLTYMLIKPKINLQFSTGYDFTNNGVAEINYLNDEMLIINTYGNVGHMRNFNCNAYIQWTITPKTRFMTNASIRYARASQEGLKLSRWNPSMYCQLRQDLPWKIQGQAFAWYSNGYLNDVYSYSDSPFSTAFYYGLSLSRAFLKQDRLNVRLSVSNPFFPKYDRYRTYTVNGDYKGWNEHISREGCQVAIQISYRFGSLQAQVKKTDHSISNDDLVGRKSE